MTYQMARLSMTMSGAKGHFCSFKLAIPITQEISRVLTTMCLHINWKAHAVCDLNFIVKGERLLKVTGSHLMYTGKVVISQKRC